MSTRRRRRIAIGVLALVGIAGVPSASQAQLFPDLQIRRERPCCVQEDPRYHMVREVYFGYYPTCWRQFPPGWGCYPKVGMADWEAAKIKMPVKPSEENAYLEEPRGGGASRRRLPPAVPGGPAEAPRRPGLPLPEASGSLFEGDISSPPRSRLNNPPAAGSGTLPTPRPNPNPTLPSNPDNLFNPSGTTPPETNLTPEPIEPGNVIAELPVPATEIPAMTAPVLEAGEASASRPEVLLEGELPQAPPLGPPALANPPVSGALGPIPGPASVETPAPAPAPSQVQETNRPRKPGFLANILGRTRKR